MSSGISGLRREEGATRRIMMLLSDLLLSDLIAELSLNSLSVDDGQVGGGCLKRLTT